MAGVRLGRATLRAAASLPLQREGIGLKRVVWRLPLSASDVVCYLVRESEHLALRVDHGSECVVAEMMPDEETALRRAEEVRRTLETRLRQ
jgi:hypothetical protein